MIDPERIRAIAAALLEKSADNSSIDRAAQLLKLASETENQAAQAAKCAAEEQKLRDDLVDARAHRRFQELKADIMALTPLLTTFVLAGTLVLQLFQFREQSREIERGGAASGRGRRNRAAAPFRRR